MDLRKHLASNPPPAPTAPERDDLARTIDLTGLPADLGDSAFHVDSRVERLNGESEQSQWGTITSRVPDGDRGDWLVVDNAGVTHRDGIADLAPAIRGRTGERGSDTR
jgi:hypothetical protein